MAFREVDVVEVREVLRGWLDGAGLRTVAERAGVDRKTARRYVRAAEAAGLSRDAGVAAVTDELVGAVVGAVRPARPSGHGAAWDLLLERKSDITEWVKSGLTIVKIEVLLTRSGTSVPYRTLHRFATQECGLRPRDTTVRVLVGDPGVECQIDFAQMGFIDDQQTGRRRKVHALIFTAVFSRHLFVHLTYSQTLAEVIAGCEAAWAFFGGVFKVLIPDNLKPVVTAADAVNPRLSVGWLDYSQHAGFVTDPARVRTPQDKPMVERAVQYVRGNFFAGEKFTDLTQAQTAATVWCTRTAGMRIHGSTAARPLEVFNELEQAALLPVPTRYDVPVLRPVKVHRDFHVEIGKALYSVPVQYIGATLDARADRDLVKLFHRGQLVKVHPRQPPGGRWTDPNDLPAEQVGYAMRDLDRLTATAAGHGRNVGIYAARLLDDPLPWTRMRAVYRLLGLVRRYGAGPVDTACGTALDLDVVSVAKIDSMLAKALESAAPAVPPPPGTRPAGSAATLPNTAAVQRLSPSSQTRPIKGATHDQHRCLTGAGRPGRRRAGRAPPQAEAVRVEHTLPERLSLARTRQISHAQFLELLLADEVSRRDARSAELRSVNAGLMPLMRLDTWTEPPDLHYDRALLSDLASLRFVEAGHNALLLGPVGVGKTHLANALGHIAIRRRLTVQAARADRLFTRLRAARLDNTLEAEFRRLIRIDLLIIDDFALRPLDATTTADFYELVVERHHRHSTIITSNREPADWLTMTTDPLLAQSAVDRLTANAHTLIIEGPSHRQRPTVDSQHR